MRTESIADARSRRHGFQLVAGPARGHHPQIAGSLALAAGLLRMKSLDIPDSQPIEGSQVRLTLAALGARIETLGRLHELLTRGGPAALIEPAEYLRDVSEASVRASAAGAAVELRFNAEPCRAVTAGEALLLGLMLDELVTNAVKHAHPAGVAGKIDVSCSGASDGSILIRVSDDGVGLPEGLDPEESDHFGMRLVHSLATELRAAIGFADSGLGLSVAVQIAAS